MTDTVDTTPIPLDEPVDEGFIKILEHEAHYSDISILEETTSSDFLETDEYSHLKRLTYDTRKPIHLLELLSIGARSFTRSLITGLAATQMINLARLSSRNQLTTAIDVAPMINIWLEKQSRIISVSPDLIMPRAQVQASSLLAPSGAYLTWVEMLEEDLYDKEQ